MDELRFDVDGALNAMEFKRMVETISRQSLNLPECERFLAYIDKNGDNSLQLDEIVAFVSKGMAISDNQRKAWQNKVLYTKSYSSSSIEWLLLYKKTHIYKFIRKL